MPTAQGRLEARMLLRTFTVAALLVTLLSMGAAAQNAGSVVAAASKAMGADTLNSITYSGTARNGAFGQSKAIGDPLGPVNVTQITHVHAHDQLRHRRPTATALVSRATGPTQPPTVPGVPAPMPGVFNQNITGTQVEHQLEPGAERLDDAVGLPEGRGRQQRHRAPAGRPAGRLVLAGEPQVAVGADVHRDRLHQQPEPGHQGRDARRQRGRRRSAGRVRVLELPEHERRAGPGPHRSAAGRPGDVRRRHHGGDAESREPRPSCSRLRRLRPAAAGGPGGAPVAAAPAGRRPRRPSRSSATASSRSAATTRRSPSTWAITSSWSRAVRATRAAWR